MYFGPFLKHTLTLALQLGLKWVRVGPKTYLCPRQSILWSDIWNVPYIEQASIRNCLNCVRNCNDHSSLDNQYCFIKIYWVIPCRVIYPMETALRPSNNCDESDEDEIGLQLAKLANVSKFGRDIFKKPQNFEGDDFSRQNFNLIWFIRNVVGLESKTKVSFFNKWWPKNYCYTAPPPPPNDLLMSSAWSPIRKRYFTNEFLSLFHSS